MSNSIFHVLNTRKYSDIYYWVGIISKKILYLWGKIMNTTTVRKPNKILRYIFERALRIVTRTTHLIQY